MMVMVVMVTFVRFAVQVYDTANDEKQGPAHIQGPEVLDVFVSDEQENMGAQAHHDAYHSNVLVGIHFFEIIYFGIFTHVGLNSKPGPECRSGFFVGRGKV
jgi:hypothetical protein